MNLKKVWVILICFGIIFSCNFLQAANFKKKSICYIQKELQILGYYHGKFTCILDKNTKEAVKKFQKDHGLKIDGIPGKRTKKCLKEVIEKKIKNKKHTETKNQVNKGKQIKNN